ncbi:MAG: aspartyl protease family protein [Oligoflexia bacterium]|nr:aspartyl protease family protein [Oligoflexia bacterium]
MQNKKIEFSFTNNLIILDGQVFGKSGKADLLCAIDTACGVTTINSDFLFKVGYKVSDGLKISNAVSTSGKEQGFLLNVSKFVFGGLEFYETVIDALYMPEGLGIDCLIGNDILSRYKVIIDYKNEILELN